MNTNRSSDAQEQKALQILNELSDNGSVTQRDLSSRLGIALGLVNSYIKNLISKGYITVKSIPPRRFAYYLTPGGFTEKTRLTYHLLQDYTRIYGQARTSLKKLFSELHASGIKRVVFAGADEVAEIAYITLQETDIELVDVMDTEKAGKNFFGRHIRPLSDVSEISCDCIVVTSFLKGEKIYRELLENRAEKEKIRLIFAK